MLESRSKKGEQDAVPSYGLRGYEEVERIKAKVEEACPLTVSCADIIALAARDAVYLVSAIHWSNAFVSELECSIIVVFIAFL